ncbi:universal stress protein [Paraburkholderia megapolitana]
MVAVDDSKTSGYAFDTALRLARETCATLQPLYVVDVPLMSYDSPGFNASIIRQTLYEDGRNVINGALTSMKRDGVQGIDRIVETNVTDFDVAHCILRAAATFNADLVVMGTHGRSGIRRLVLGSVAERFLRIAECPVLMVGARAAERSAAGTTTAVESVKEPS